VNIYIYIYIYSYINNILIMNKEIISKFIFNELFKHKTISKYKDIPNTNSIFNKLLDNYYHPIEIDQIYRFYQPLYFKNYQIDDNITITNVHLNQLKELCYQLNVFKKVEIPLPDNIYNQKNITCSNQSFYYYLFNLFGTYYYPTSHNSIFNGIYPFYIRSDTQSCYVCVEYISIFWKDLYFFSKYKSQVFKQKYCELMYQTIIPLIVKNSIKKRYYIQIQFPFEISKNQSNSDYEYYSKEELQFKLNDYVGYNNPLIQMVSFEKKKPQSNVFDKCFTSNSQSRRITFEFNLLNTLINS